MTPLVSIFLTQLTVSMMKKLNTESKTIFKEKV